MHEILFPVFFSSRELSSINDGHCHVFVSVSSQPKAGENVKVVALGAFSASLSKCGYPMGKKDISLRAIPNEILARELVNVYKVKFWRNIMQSLKS